MADCHSLEAIHAREQAGARRIDDRRMRRIETHSQKDNPVPELPLGITAVDERMLAIRLIAR